MCIAFILAQISEFDKGEMYLFKFCTNLSMQAYHGFKQVLFDNVIDNLI